MDSSIFDIPVERHGTDSLKFDRALSRHRSPDLLSLWVADMDFKTPDAVTDAIVERTRHGIFGYTEPDDSYYEAVAGWMSDRHGWAVKKEWFVILPGVVFGLAAAVRAFSQPGDAVLIMPPVYYPFTEVIVDNGRELAEVPLVYSRESGRYSIDYDAFEHTAVASGAKLFLLCSPHNPAGRIWTRDELVRLGEICLSHGITIVSDEIHMDFERTGYRHIPTASISSELAHNTVSLTSASKTFNLAGLHAAHAIIENPELRKRFTAEVQAAGYSQGNTLGLVATKAAYQHGGAWLDALLEYLEDNWRFLGEFIEERLPELSLIKAEGTYLAWIDCSSLGMDDGELQRFILEDAGLWLDQGHIFGKSGSGFIRINIATQQSYLRKALEQLEAAVIAWRKA